MLNKNFFKVCSLFTLVMFLSFLLAMPTPCFASIYDEKISGYGEEESYDGSWHEEEEEENKEEEENNEGNHRDDDSDPSGGGNPDIDLNIYNSPGEEEEEKVPFDNEEDLPDVYEVNGMDIFEEEEEEFLGDLDAAESLAFIEF